MPTITEIIKNLRLTSESGSCASEEPKREIPQEMNCELFGFDGTENLNPKFRKKWFRMDESHPEVRRMCEAAEGWVRRFLLGGREKRLLVIYGRTGTGKSMVSRAALRAISLIGISAWSEGYRQTCPKARDSFEWSVLSAMGPADRNDGTRWVDAIEAEAAIFQDIGTEIDRFKSGGATENLRLLLEERRNKWTIITTNVPQENWEEAWDLRVSRRLDTNSEIIAVRTAPTYKKQR